MWVMTPDGIYMPGLRPESKIPEGDHRELQVRSRRRKDLIALRDNYLPELGNPIKIRGTDYQWRAYCTRAEWGAALARMAEGIDYVKFKEQARDRELHDAYLEVWSVLASRFGTGYKRTR